MTENLTGQLPLHTLETNEPEGLAFCVEREAKLKGGMRLRKPNGEIAIALNNSLVSDFLTCKLLFLERQVHMLQRKGKNIDQSFGGAIHEGLATYYTSGRAVLAAQEAFLATFEDMAEEDTKTRANGLKLLVGYHERWEQEGWEILEVETPILFQYGPEDYFVVIPDMVVKSNGRIYGVEHKTSRYTVDQAFYNRFKMDPQITAEAAGIKAKFGMCDGVIINPITIQKGGRSGRPSPYLQYGPRDICNRSQEDIDWWRKDMREVHKEIQKVVAEGYYVADKRNCSSFKNPCEFFRLHESHGNELIKREEYHERSRNPRTRGVPEE